MKVNFLFFLNSYSDICQTSTPALNQFEWTRQINGIPFNAANSQQIQVLAGNTSPNLVPYMFSSPVATTAATTNGTDNLTITGSVTGITAGQLIVGTDIPVGTTVKSITGSVVVMSQAATGSASPTVSFYQPAAFIYMESDQQLSVIYNNGSPVALNPFQVNGLIIPGVFFISGPAYNLTVTNLGIATANIFLASMG